MKRLFTLLLISFAALSCEIIDEKLDDLLDKRDWVIFAEGTELTVDVPSKQTVLNYKFESTLDWEVKTDAEWLEIDPTSGMAGKDIKIQIKVLHNKDKEGRTGYADLTLSNDESYRITINQAGEGYENDDIVVDIPNNQIWYTSTDGEIVESYSGENNNYADSLTTFGVNIVSNTYVDGKGVIEFDGDVTVIGDAAFLDCDNIKNIILPNSITTIGGVSFYDCDNIEVITIPESVTTIGSANWYGGGQTFRGCDNLREFKGKFATEDGRCLIIDDALTCFAQAELTEYIIPDNVIAIKDCVFMECNTLENITIPDSVTTIGDYAFASCSSLTSVTIGDSVTTIGHAAFGWCENLEAVHITDLVSWCNIDFINPFTNGSVDLSANPLCNAQNLYLNGELVTDLVIPDGVNEIKLMAFANCSSLTSVTIPDSVTEIGYCAFYDCDNLTSVTIGDSVTAIGGYAFYDCYSLTSVTIPNSVTTIEWSAFEACHNLTSVTIPDSVTEIGDQAFGCCSSLTSVTIPDSVTEIGDYAFYGCSSLASVTIPDSVTTIGECAFWNCHSLTSVYCKATTPPAGGSGMFSFNASGRKIYVPMESVEAYKSADGWSGYASSIEGYNF